MNDIVEANIPIKAFISYSWTSKEHEAFVVELAERLVADGVDVILDKWELKEGHDKNSFMEKMVTDPSVRKVIILSDKRYADKANGREGGVGIESQIISEEVYQKVKQDKFIPVIIEFDTEGKACLPVFLKSRFAIDFSTLQNIQSNYEQLLRSLYDKPALQKPKLGTPPTFITHDVGTFSPNKTALDSFVKAIHDDKSTYIPLARDYLNRFNLGLESFRIIAPAAKIDEEFDRSYHDMLAARDELIDFYTEAFSFKDDIQLLEIVIDFLENSINYNFPLSSMSSYNELWFENYRLFNYENFIYLVAFLIKYKRYALVDSLLSRDFYIEYRSRMGNDPLRRYPFFHTKSNILYSRNEKLNPPRLSPIADLIKDRASNPNVSFADFRQAEMIILLRCICDDWSHGSWFPHSLIYSKWSQAYPLFARAVSDVEFSHLSQMMSGINKADLKAKIDTSMAGKLKPMLDHWAFHSDVYLKPLINYDKIFGTLK